MESYPPGGDRAVTLGPTLETARLVLRPPRREDFETYVLHVADPEVMRHLGGAQSRPVAWRGYLQYAGAWAVGAPSMFFVFEKASGAFMGRIGPWVPEGWPGLEVGWSLSRAFQGQGYATEAATACIDYALDALGWDEVIHSIDPANTASIAVAERLGSSRRPHDAMLPDPINKVVGIWGQRADQWRARRGR